MRIHKVWPIVSLIFFLFSLPLSAQNTNNYMEQGGSRWVVGGELEVISSGELKIDGTVITATAAELNKMHGVTATTEDINTLTGVASQFIVYQVEDLAAAADIAARPIFVCPTGFQFTISSISILSQGTPAGIDNSNTCIIVVANGTNAIVTKTYNAETAFPADGTAGDLGALSGTYKIITAGEMIKFSITNGGTTSDPPAFILQIVGTLETV